MITLTMKFDSNVPTLLPQRKDLHATDLIDYVISKMMKSQGRKRNVSELRGKGEKKREREERQRCLTRRIRMIIPCRSSHLDTQLTMGTRAV